MKSAATVSVTDLKKNLSRYLRRVRDDNVGIDVTIRGEVWPGSAQFAVLSTARN